MSEASEREDPKSSETKPDKSSEASPLAQNELSAPALIAAFVGHSPRICLHIPEAMKPYAARHGAKYDPAQKQWYVLGDVPEALESFGPPPARRQPVYEYSPPCPTCGAYMVKRFRKRDRDPFWSCSRYPTCKGIVVWTPAMPPATPSEIIQEFTQPTPAPAKPPSPALRVHLTRKWKELTAQLALKLGSIPAAEDWLFKQHPALQEKTPAETMLTMEGTIIVEKIIQALPPNTPG